MPNVCYLMCNDHSLVMEFFTHANSIDKSKALSLVLHCADVSHVAKVWKLHFRWTMQLLEEFFRQVSCAD